MKTYGAVMLPEQVLVRKREEVFRLGIEVHLEQSCYMDMHFLTIPGLCLSFAFSHMLSLRSCSCWPT